MRECTLDETEALSVGAWILGLGGDRLPDLGLLKMPRRYQPLDEVVDPLRRSGWKVTANAAI
jgi:DUF917 family protein